ncbi:MAG: zinc-binding dehydrogenase [Bacteriovoracaceae bacterium]|nr:zinc-binding dehydrogenase [Bacteriovoracaceae bacterium]
MDKFVKIQLIKPGKFNHLRLIEGILAKLSDDAVRVKVHFSGLNFADVMMRLGLYPDAPVAPFCPGYEISGEVIEVGSNVEGLKVGDRVMSGMNFGGYSSICDAPAWQVRKIPNTLTNEEAAGLIVSGLTCDLAFGELARVRPSDRVMIDCASGALGALSIQYLKQCGVKEIIGLTSKEEKLAIIQESGVKALLLKEWNESSERVDVVLNSRAGESLHRDRLKLNPLGRLVAIGASHMVKNGQLSFTNVIKEFLKIKKISPIQLMNENHGVFGLNVLKLFSEPRALTNSFDNLTSGKFELRPRIDKVFKAEEIEEALNYLGRGLSKGKVLIDWSSL